MVASPWTFAAQSTADLVSIRVDVGNASGERVQQLAQTARHTLNLFTEWLGPYPAPALTVVEASWRSSAEPSPAGIVAVPLRLVEPSRDPAAERRLIGAIASHYWVSALSGPRDQRWFAEALVQYLGARAIDTILERRQHSSARYFGGFIPYPIGVLPLSPVGAVARGHVRHYDADIAMPRDSDRARVRRATIALLTLERLIGWPALQPALAALRAHTETRRAAPSDLSAILSEQLGTNLDWFFAHAFQIDSEYDYAAEQVSVDPDGDKFHVRVALQRRGNAVFGIERQSHGPALPVEIEFADGSAVIERWPGGRSSLTLEYMAASPAVRVAVDPEAMLLLDHDPANNVRRLTGAPITGVSLRATMTWLTWIEDFMLTCLALA